MFTLRVTTYKCCFQRATKCHKKRIYVNVWTDTFLKYRSYKIFNTSQSQCFFECPFFFSRKAKVEHSENVCYTRNLSSDYFILSNSWLRFSLNLLIKMWFSCFKNKRSSYKIKSIHHCLFFFKRSEMEPSENDTADYSDGSFGLEFLKQGLCLRNFGCLLIISMWFFF